MSYNYGCFYFADVQDSQSKQSGYSMHQLQGNKEFGCEKKGYLFKKSDGWAYSLMWNIVWCCCF